MSVEPALVRWGFWLRWTLASIVAGAIGLSLGDFPSGVGLLRGTDLSDLSGWTEGWAGILASMAFGAMQWLVLRREIGRGCFSCANRPRP